MQVLCGKEIYTESFIELTRSSQLRVSTVFGLLIGNANELPCLVKATVQWKEICYPFCQIWVCRHNDGSNRFLTLNFFAFWPYTMLNLEGSTFKLRTTSLNRPTFVSLTWLVSQGFEQSRCKYTFQISHQQKEVALIRLLKLKKMFIMLVVSYK